MENLQSNLFYSLAGVAAVASLASCTNKQKTTEQKAAEHRLYYDRRPYSPDDELL